GWPAGGGAGGLRAGRGQAADPDKVRGAARCRGSAVKGMKASDLRSRTVDELSEEVDTLGREIFNLRFQRASGQLENTARVRQVRRDIARIKTILGERRRTAPPQAP